MRSLPVVRWLAVLALTCLAPGCNKQKSKAAEAYELFAEALARGHVAKAKELAADGAEFAVASSPTGVGEPEEGKILHQPVYDSGIVGIVWWTRHKVESEKSGSLGTTTLVAVEDVCRQSSEANGCTRPSTYRHRVKLREVGGQWKVTAFSEETINEPR